MRVLYKVSHADQTCIMPTPGELKESIATYEALIANYTLARGRMIARRKGASDHIMVELDERLEANKRTIDAFQRAIEITRAHLQVVERDQTLSGEDSGS
jgi:hypothetical protein